MPQGLGEIQGTGWTAAAWVQPSPGRRGNVVFLNFCGPPLETLHPQSTLNPHPKPEPYILNPEP